MRPLTTAEVSKQAMRIVVARLVSVGAVVGGAIVGSITQALDAEFNFRRAAAEQLVLAALALASTSLLSFASLRAVDTSRPGLRWKITIRAVAAGVVNAPVWAGLALLYYRGLHVLRSIPYTSFAQILTNGILGAVLLCIGLAAFATFSSIASVPLAIAYGQTHTYALGSIRCDLERPSWHAMQRARATAITIDWLATGVTGALAACAPSPATWVSLGLIAVLLVVDGCLFQFARMRLHRWIRRIRGDSRYRLVSREECSVPPDLAPIDRTDARFAVVDARPTMPYRELPIAIALIPRK